MHRIVAEGKFVQAKSFPGVYAIADQRKNGTLSKKWLLVESRVFTSNDNDNPINILVCDCAEGHENKVRLSSIDMIIVSETLQEFQAREESKYCRHCTTVQHLKQDCDYIPSGLQTLTEVICTSPFAAFAKGGSQGIAVVTAGHRQFKCERCRDSSCEHIASFSSWNEARQFGDNDEASTVSNNDNDIDALQEAFAQIKLSRRHREQSFKCVSTHPISWPVNDHYRQIKSKVDNHGFPSVLIPKLETSSCEHGSSFVLSELRNDAIIHRASSVKIVTLCSYNSASPNCDCSVPYDGQDDLLLNLNNKLLFDLEWMFSILDRSNYSESPLRSAFTTATLARQRCENPEIAKLSYGHLSEAYNSFIR